MIQLKPEELEPFVSTSSTPYLAPSSAAPPKAVRFVYSALHPTKQQSAQFGIPNAVHYTPFHYTLLSQLEQEHADRPEYRCSNCDSYVNIHCEFVKQQRTWVCCICGNYNPMAQGLKYAPLAASHTYRLVKPDEPSLKPNHELFVFVVDLCVSTTELQAVQNSLVEFIDVRSAAPDTITKIALITYSKYVYVYELSSNLNTVVCISASNNYENEELVRMLGLSADKYEGEVVNRYFGSTKTAREKLIRRVRNMKPEGSVCNQGDPARRCRARRALGQALSVALSFNQLLPMPSRIVTLVGGPCTFGLGQVIPTGFSYAMRSIKEYQQDQNLPFVESATTFYKTLKPKAEAKGAIIDLFVFSIEQTGLRQLYELVRVMGGLLVLGEQFANKSEVFSRSFRKAYIRAQGNDLAESMIRNCITSIACSSDIVINGAIGLCKPLKNPKGKRYIGEKSFGFGNTNSWYLGGADCYKSITIFYEHSAPRAASSCYYLQFKTEFQTVQGYSYRQITTVRRDFSPKCSPGDSIDHQAAIIAVARWYLYKEEFEPKVNMLQWLDKILIKWARKCAGYYHDQQILRKAPSSIIELPLFFYNFRRTAFVRRAGLSLDELTYQAHYLMRMPVDLAVSMVQSALLSYDIENPSPVPATLTQGSMKNEVILLLDTFYNVVLWHGEVVEHWKKEGYHLQKQYANVKELLEAPEQHVTILMTNRFPAPAYYLTTPGHPRERILKARLISDRSAHNENTLSDQASFMEFLNTLIEYASAK